MKRHLLAPLLCLAVLLTGCKPSEEVVWQTTLDNTGTQVRLSNCTVQTADVNYRFLSGQTYTEQQVLCLYAQESAPVLWIDAPKSQIEVTFADAAGDGFALYEKALPVEQVDMIPTELPDGTTEYRFDTIYNFAITVTDGEKTDRLLLSCSRDGYNEKNPAAAG